MKHALVTVVAPIGSEKVKSLPAEISALGNPATRAIADRLDQLDGPEMDCGTHFASLHAIPAASGKGGHLILEFSADGSEDAALKRLDEQIGGELKTIFAQAQDWRQGDNLLAYLRRHRVKVGHGLMDSPGLAFDGTPGMSVGRIRKERDLAAEVMKLLGSQGRGVRAIDRLTEVRNAIAKNPAFAWALTPPPAPAPENAGSIVAVLAPIVLSFLRTFLWPVGLAIAIWIVYASAAAWFDAPEDMRSIWLLLGAAANAAWRAFWIALLFVVVVAAGLYFSLRAAEATDSLEERAPERGTLDAILEREDFGAQNHMVSVTERKPGLVRWFTLRFVFWAITQFATRVYRPGFLSGIGTIHFARWVTVPGTRDFIFFSNYGGSWEAYLEDFITRAHFGLTGVWSNSIGFPRSTNLIQGGATDGERFKRYARRSMLPTPFWYSAYPDTTTAQVRSNALIRRGLASALSDEEAVDWLALFGSVERPEAKLESSDIQSLVFGGLGFLPFGVCLFYELSGDEQQAQRFLDALRDRVAFGDGRRLKHDAVITLGLGPQALEKLGLPEDCVTGFPAAFLGGMAKRARILGDIEAPNRPETWRWGGEAPLDIAMLIYGNSPNALRALESDIKEWANAHGSRECARIELKEVTENKTEPFGFVDGISQPVIRGTYKGLRSPDWKHLVEPGEFLIGYRDNRGNMPPGPTLSPLLDPHNRLAIAADDHDFASNIVNAPRELGRNGTFLVIRQLAQDVAAFERYCQEQADKLSDRLGPPYRIDAEFIGAKLVGRWKDGSSLVRNPYKPRSEEVSGEERLKAVSRSQPDAERKPPVEATVRPGARPDNDFLFGEEDPEALRCPFGAHVRRANPRDSFDPGSRDQIAISNRHRLLRVGRFYQPNDGQHPGLLFMCLNGDIERQFEFIQQTWLASPSFHGLSGEQDPIVGGDKVCTGFVIPNRDGPVRLNAVPRFVTTLGGGYFFLPSKRLLRFLSGDR